MAAVSPVRRLDAADIAKISYEAVRAYNQQIFGDYSQKPWDKLAAEERGDWLSRIHFRRVNPNAPASAGHDNWMAERLYDGWKYAEYVDAKQKVHNRLIPWSRLDQNEQLRDVLFANVVDALLRSL